MRNLKQPFNVVHGPLPHTLPLTNLSPLEGLAVRAGITVGFQYSRKLIHEANASVRKDSYGKYRVSTVTAFD